MPRNMRLIERRSTRERNTMSESDTVTAVVQDPAVWDIEEDCCESVVAEACV